ncbi:hypothetical protein A2U01_0072738, partial [Trifolium medium]|nr:hypothetical protein [Trifolium medium]
CSRLNVMIPGPPHDPTVVSELMVEPVPCVESLLDQGVQVACLVDEFSTAV